MLWLGHCTKQENGERKRNLRKALFLKKKLHRFGGALDSKVFLVRFSASASTSPVFRFLFHSLCPPNVTSLLNPWLFLCVFLAFLALLAFAIEQYLCCSQRVYNKVFINVHFPHNVGSCCRRSQTVCVTKWLKWHAHLDPYQWVTTFESRKAIAAFGQELINQARLKCASTKHEMPSVTSKLFAAGSEELMSLCSSYCSFKLPHITLCVEARGETHRKLTLSLDSSSKGGFQELWIRRPIEHQLIHPASTASS